METLLDSFPQLINQSIIYRRLKEEKRGNKYMQQIAYSVVMAFNNLPRSYRIIFGSLIVFTLIIAIWQPCLYYPDSVQIIKNFGLKNEEIHFLLSESNKMIGGTTQEDNTISVSQDILNNKIANKVNMHKHIVSIGDTLSSILNRYGINIADIHQLIIIDKDLCNLNINQQLFWTLTADGYLQYLIWKISHHEIRTYNRTVSGFKMSKKIQQGNWINSVLKSTIDDNFISSARDAGLTSREIGTIIKAMQLQIDFRKLKKGDAFSVLVSRKILNGKHEQSQLLGIHLRSEGKNYYAIRAKDGKLYDRNGTDLTENTFLRFPTSKQFRISSNFNLRRLNPITGRITPHRGVDFAMPQGTPVLAVGDGEMIVAKRSNAAGYYIAVRHGHTYTTRYMHLQKLLVKPGQKVKRGDRIALSGNTGRSTGPHLHYEVWINQQAVNPLTAKLPRTKRLTGKDRTEYLSQVKAVTQQLCFD